MRIAREIGGPSLAIGRRPIHPAARGYTYPVLRHAGLITRRGDLYGNRTEKCGAGKRLRESHLCGNGGQHDHLERYSRVHTFFLLPFAGPATLRSPARLRHRRPASGRQSCMVGAFLGMAFARRGTKRLGSIRSFDYTPHRPLVRMVKSTGWNCETMRGGTIFGLIPPLRKNE